MEATKERAARRDRATPARTSGSSPAHGSRTQSITRRRRRAKAGGESFAGQMLVAQCILNAAEKEGVQPSEAVEIYSYTSNRPDPAQSVKDAVAAVFDRGEVAIDAPVMYFYNPALVTSTWHESQIFVAEVGGHRFFAERSPNE